MDALLVATDLSERSDRAVARAFRLAAETGARLVALSVVDAELPEAARGALAEAAEAHLAALPARFPGAAAVSFTPRVVLGDPLRDILREADAAGAALLVLGRHRERPFLDLFRSTTMEKLVRAALLPVLLVREPAVGPYGSVLAGVDLSPASAAALRWAARVAPAASIRAFHAWSIPFKGFLGEEAAARAIREEAAEGLAAWRAGANLPEAAGRIELIEGAVGAAFRACLASARPDLVAIGAHGRPTLSPTLLGAFTEELLRDPPTDLLVVRR